jgi:hypothetical protein
LWSRLERQNADARKRSSQPLHVARIAGCDDKSAMLAAGTDGKQFGVGIDCETTPK